MAQDMVAFIERVIGGPAYVAGHSGGAIVALLVALRRPDLVERVVLISGVFHRDGWIPHVIDPERELHEAIARGYAELSPDGAEHFSIVAQKLKRMDFEQPTLRADDLGPVASRTLVMVADDDEVTLEHSMEMYSNLPNAEPAIIPGTSHGLLHEKPSLCNEVIVEFLTTDPTPTIAPALRAS